MRNLFIIVALVLLFGCSEPQEKPSTAVLNTINISLYSTVHPAKAQPMLINVVSDRKDIIEYSSKLQTNQEAELPIQYADRVYYLQLEYVTNGMSEYKDFLYVSTSEDKAYVKEFKMASKYDYDHFDDRSKASLLDSIGIKGWYLLTEQLLI